MRESVQQSDKWIRSPAWDGFWMFSGLWAPLLALVGFGVVNALVEVDPRSYGDWINRAGLFYLALAVLHRLTTTYAALGTPFLAEERRARPARFYWVPLAITLACIALAFGVVFHSINDFMPTLHGRFWPYFLLAYVMVLWERWHFCAQEFGVLSIYRIRARQSSAADKRFDRTYTVVLMLGVNMVLYARAGYADECDILMYGTSLHGCRQTVWGWLGHVAFALGVLATGYAIVRELRHERSSLPKALFYLLVGGHTLFIYLYPNSLKVFFLSYAFHHWMVAVGLFGRVTLRKREGDAPRSHLGRLAAISAITLVTLGFYLFMGPLDKAGALSPTPNEHWFQGIAVSDRMIAATAMGVFFALNFLHYYFDRVFYAFSNPAVRAHVAPRLLD